jgi:putative tricarboxylic transport membrane protein
MPRIKNMNDVLAGTFMVTISAIALWLSWRLNSGSAAAMGPGYIPKMLAFILVALGTATIFQGFVQEGHEFESWYPRPLVFILASVSFFGLTIERFGLAVAVVGLVLIGCLANKGTKTYEAVILGLVMAAFTILVFVKALGLPIVIWPSMLMGY